MSFTDPEGYDEQARRLADESSIRIEDERYDRVLTQWIAGFQVHLIKIAGMSDEKALEVARAHFARHREVIDPKRAASAAWVSMRDGG